MSSGTAEPVRPPDECPVLHIELLHHFRATCNGLPLELGRSGERMVAYLALEDRSLARDHIAGALWPDTSQSRAAASLRRALSVVRHHVPGLIRSQARRLSLVSGTSVDVRAQRCLIEAITGGERNTATADELRLLRGDLLPDWDEPWLAASRQELRQLRMISLEAVAAAHLGESRPWRSPWHSAWRVRNRCARARTVWSSRRISPRPTGPRRPATTIATGPSCGPSCSCVRALAWTRS